MPVSVGYIFAAKNAKNIDGLQRFSWNKSLKNTFRKLISKIFNIRNLFFNRTKTFSCQGVSLGGSMSI